MGVPKFYRWISERYPCISQVVKEYQLPEFDNLYLDMNGIIHHCSHPSDDPHFRLSEEQMFQDIFHYIEVLFFMIQPQKVFFMAVDGVAPRAKMNQQRGRRFRTAKEAENAENAAREKGEVLPDEPRFDSNCITPGTEFMTRLDYALQSFVKQKVSYDSTWKKCKVIYSSHMTPGEGEHKIMEYIRFVKSQPDYSSNVRHCLYGLDADLIMLGLSTHEPHFCLLREEVRFGRQVDKKRTIAPEEITFHFLHLGLMREYIDKEFSVLKDKLTFPYDLESVIDDWILMGFLVGNDFIPHLPNFHIDKNGLDVLYRTYMEVLPKVDGYLNEAGTLNLKRFDKFLLELKAHEVSNFEEYQFDLKYLKTKSSGNHRRNEGLSVLLGMSPAANSKDESSDDDLNLVVNKLKSLGVNYGDEDFSDSSDCDEFFQHKQAYYEEKMNPESVDREFVHRQAVAYVEAIQWILHYYFDGVSSWSWFYPENYAPYVSDINDFTDMDMNFTLGTPFLPFEQLLAVLPPQSRNLLPGVFQDLMVNNDSPLKEFYPSEFKTDLNGKRNDWEAVVLIPFINEDLLLEVIRPLYSELTPAEMKRNSHGPMFIYTHCENLLPSSQGSATHTKVELVHRDDWEVHTLKIYKGLCKNVDGNYLLPGFSTFYHIEHEFCLKKEGIKVFQQESRSENMILKVVHPEEKEVGLLAKELIGKVVLVGWPHLHEALVVAAANASERIEGKSFSRKELNEFEQKAFHRQSESVKYNYLNRWGISVGRISIIIYARLLTGKSYSVGSNGKISLQKDWAEYEQPYAWHMIVKEAVYDGTDEAGDVNLTEHFPPDSTVFMLGHPHYGSMGQVLEIDPKHKGRIRIKVTLQQPMEFSNMNTQSNDYYTALKGGQKLGLSDIVLAYMTGTVYMSRPTNNPVLGSEANKNRINIGMNLKNNKKGTEAVGYTRKDIKTGVWLYSDKCLNELYNYWSRFPEPFEFLCCHRDAPKDLQAEEVFGDMCSVRVAELVEFLSNSDFHKSFKQPCGTENLSAQVIARVYDQATKLSGIMKRTVKMQVRPHLLFKPNKHQGVTPPDKSVKTQLLDRVVNVRDGCAVPLGLVGTVVGIEAAPVDTDKVYVILFDKPFVGGLTVSGTPYENHSYRLHCGSFINISHGYRKSSSDNLQPYDIAAKGENSCAGRPKPPHFFQPNQQIAVSNYPHQIRSPSEVNCVVHGSYYVHWPDIMQTGLHRGSKDNIPFLSYIPQKISGPHMYQLLIFINVSLALGHGIPFILLSAGQVLSPGDRSGSISPLYFSRVVDVESGQIIFPRNEATGSMPCVPGRGRGYITRKVKKPQTSKIFEDIWMPMQKFEEEQRICTENAMGRSFSASSSSQSQPARKEVSLDEIFRTSHQIASREGDGKRFLLAKDKPVGDANRHRVSQPTPSQVSRQGAALGASLSKGGNDVTSAPVDCGKLSVLNKGLDRDPKAKPAVFCSRPRNRPRKRGIRIAAHFDNPFME